MNIKSLTLLPLLLVTACGGGSDAIENREHVVTISAIYTALSPSDRDYWDEITEADPRGRPDPYACLHVRGIEQGCTHVCPDETLNYYCRFDDVILGVVTDEELASGTVVLKYFDEDQDAPDESMGRQTIGTDGHIIIEELFFGDAQGIFKLDNF